MSKDDAVEELINEIEGGAFAHNLKPHIAAAREQYEKVRGDYKEALERVVERNIEIRDSDATIAALKQRVEVYVDALEDIGSVDSPQAQERFYEYNGGPVGVIQKIVGTANDALSKASTEAVDK